MKIFNYTKINGAGNDFVLIDKKINPDIFFSELEIAKICDRKSGIGADGVILLDDSANSDFEMQYFNADGSTGSLCGNGARCAIKYAQMSNRINEQKAYFLNNNAKYSGEILTNSVIKFNLQAPTKIKLNFKVKTFGQMITANFIDTGSPHVVINISDILSNPANAKSNFKDITELPVAEIGAEIRNLSEFQPSGVNVNFVQELKNGLAIRTYERGVEGETLACGTGAVAAAIIVNLVNKKNPPIKLITKSNAELIVNFRIENNSIDNVSLTGPVEIEHEGKYSI